MHKLRVFTVLGVFASTFSVGCVTTESTRGFQTNPPARTSVEFPHSFGQAEQKNSLQKFFGSLNPGKNSRPAGTQKPDATSLQSPGTVSVELLVVAGEMGLEQGRYEAAIGYFKRAIQMEPKNFRANLGWARAESGLGNQQQASRVYESLREWYPERAMPADRPESNPRKQNFLGMKTPVGNRGMVDSGESTIEQVSFEEDVVEAGSQVISGAPSPIVLNPVAQASSPSKTMQPEILFRDLNPNQRVANPFFDERPSSPNRPVSYPVQKTGSLTNVAIHNGANTGESAPTPKGEKRVRPSAPKRLIIRDVSKMLPKKTTHHLTDATSSRRNVR